MKFTKILYPVDFSERCRTVAPFVQAAVKRHGASLTLANFVEIPALWYGTAEAPCAPDLNIGNLMDAAGERLKGFAKEFFPDTSAKILVEEGEPGDRVSTEDWVGSDALIELCPKGRVRREPIVRQFLEHVRLPALLLLENRIEVSPAKGGVRSLGLQPVDRDLP